MSMVEVEVRLVRSHAKDQESKAQTGAFCRRTALGTQELLVHLAIRQLRVMHRPSTISSHDFGAHLLTGGFLTCSSPCPRTPDADTLVSVPYA